MLADRTGQDRRVDAHEVTLVEEVVDRLLHLRAYPKAGSLKGRSQPQMPVVEEEIDPVLLGLDGVLLRGGDEFDAAHAEFVPTRRACVLLHLAGHGDHRLLRERLLKVPRRRVHLALHQHALQHPGAVPDDGERHLAVTPGRLDPAQHRDFGADVRSELPDFDRHGPRVGVRDQGAGAPEGEGRTMHRLNRDGKQRRRPPHRRGDTSSPVHCLEVDLRESSPAP